MFCNILQQGNIQELLVKEGLARCVNWSMGNVTEGADKLRAGEKAAKEKHLRIWKDYSPPANTGAEIKDKSYSAKVCFAVLRTQFQYITSVVHTVVIFALHCYASHICLKDHIFIFDFRL